jgi:hypothetical protein
VHGKTIKLTGDLAMHGVTKPVVLEGEYNGTMGSGAQQRIGFSVAGSSTARLGITWNRAVEGGGMLLGDDVPANRHLCCQNSNLKMPHAKTQGITGFTDEVRMALFDSSMSL